MDETPQLAVTDDVRIPLDELSFRFARSGGPGGQHANKVETSVELRFDLAHTPSLSEAERELALRRLKPYLDSRGVLHLVARSSRSQLANREEATRRFVELLADALVVPKKRRPTRPSRGARARRVAAKRRTGESKRRRAYTYDEYGEYGENGENDGED